MLGPITLSDYDADRRWKLRDKCLRVATFYRVMHMRERSRKAAYMRRLRRLFSGWAASFLAVAHAHSTWRCRLRMGRGCRAAADRTERRGRVSASTRMWMTAPDLYREARRNAPRRRAVVGARRRVGVRLPSVVWILRSWCASLYGDMCTIGSWVQHGLARGDG